MELKFAGSRLVQDEQGQSVIEYVLLLSLVMMLYLGVVNGLGKIGLAQKLVEQGILSFRDLSAVPIPDLVERIEGLSEELAARIIAQAQALAEES